MESLSGHCKDMERPQVHFELFIRRKVNAPWSLEQASEDRARIVEMADEMLADGRAAAVRVTKESLDAETREFRTITVLSKGAVDAARGPKIREVDDCPLCVTAQDLYTGHARERIGRLLEGWLRRKAVTPFELLHRPDLIEQLEASGVEILHAVQKIAVPEAQARGTTTHEMVRTFQALAERAIARLLADGRKNRFPKVDGPSFARTVEALSNEPERVYLLGGGVAGHIASAKTWAEKVEMILDLADQAPAAGRARGLALQVLEQPLAEIVSLRQGLAELVGDELDLGGSVAACTRIASEVQVRAILAFDPELHKQIPALNPAAARLAMWLQRDAFEAVRASLGRHVVHELNGPRRLRPADPEGEIAILRALAMALTASAPALMPLEEVQAAFVHRSKALVAGDFVDGYLKTRDTALGEIEALIRLAENVAGGVNKRAAARWIVSAVGALRFEKEIRGSPSSPTQRLATLADLQRGVKKAGLSEAEQEAICGVLAKIGAIIESDFKLMSLIARSDGPLGQRLALLLRFAAADVGPSGPVAERARAEVLKMLREPAVRAELANSPEALERVKGLIVDAGLAA
jgi:hypothetical protein